MGDRNYSYDKGSSRSARDDSRSRPHEGRERGRFGEGSRRPQKSRSRSPRRRSPEADSGRYSRERRGVDDDRYDYKRSQRNHEESDEEVPAPPPPPRITKISIDLPKPKGPIKMNIGGGGSKLTPAPKPSIASVFNEDDDEDEPEEMPAEARMRMRNIGRETPTSAGPNSFGKTKQGFCDSKKVFEKNLKSALEDEKPSAPMPKFPQTIYRIQAP